jgi:hypothetical protein
MASGWEPPGAALRTCSTVHVMGLGNTFSTCLLYLQGGASSDALSTELRGTACWVAAAARQEQLVAYMLKTMLAPYQATNSSPSSSVSPVPPLSAESPAGRRAFRGHLVAANGETTDTSGSWGCRKRHQEEACAGGPFSAEADDLQATGRSGMRVLISAGLARNGMAIWQASASGNVKEADAAAGLLWWRGGRLGRRWYCSGVGPAARSIRFIVLRWGVVNCDSSAVLWAATFTDDGARGNVQGM